MHLRHYSSRYAFSAGLLVAALAVVGCGDGPDKPPSPSATPTAVRSALPPAPAFGAAPRLEKAVTDTFPEHGTSIPRDLLPLQNPLGRSGVCFAASFEGLPEQARSFRMLVDGTEATLQFEWTVPAANNPRPPRACYVDSAKLGVGRHAIAVQVRANSVPSSPVIQAITWEFDIQ